MLQNVRVGIVVNISLEFLNVVMGKMLESHSNDYGPYTDRGQDEKEAERETFRYKAVNPSNLPAAFRKICIRLCMGKMH